MSISNCIPCEQPIALNDGRIIGRIEGDTFIKPVIESKHMLKCPPAWAIQADLFDEKVKPCVKWLVIEGKESGKRWKTSVEYFDTYKKEMDRGFGRQYLMVLARWQVIEPKSNDTHQLQLFGYVNA